MARILAKRLGAELDVVLVHKIGAPGNPEYAIGSVSEFGSIYQTDAVAFYGFSPDEVKRTAQAEIQKLRQRRASYSPVRPPISPKGRIVIIVDDGIATGSTMLAAIRAIRAQSPERVVVAAPTAAPASVEILRQEADEVIAVDTPEHFFSISQFYDDFPQVSDEEVLEALSSPEARGSKREAA
jgi:predicted phosphoribosyltransferase